MSMCAMQRKGFLQHWQSAPSIQATSPAPSFATAAHRDSRRSSISVPQQSSIRNHLLLNARRVVLNGAFLSLQSPSRAPFRRTPLDMTWLRWWASFGQGRAVGDWGRAHRSGRRARGGDGTPRVEVWGEVARRGGRYAAGCAWSRTRRGRRAGGG